MRFEGTLTQWNDERGFGFITPQPAGEAIFVHVSAFPRDGRRPQLNEALSFEITQGKGGRKQAAAVRRPAAGRSAPAAHRARNDRAREPVDEPTSAFTHRIVVFVLACAVLAAAYWQFERRQQQAARAAAAASAEATSAAPRPAAVAQPLAASPFRCDGRQHCSQMTSCAEAKFFLQSCPGTQMDGDGDGVPCEQQWCTHPGAR